MAVSSAQEALRYFMRAMDLADQIPDPLFAANARLGAAETNLRLKNAELARHLASQALLTFEDLRSHMCAGNAAERLASAHRALRQPKDVVDSLRFALSHFRQAESVIGQVNALDGLDEAMLDAGQTLAANRYFTTARDLAGDGYVRGRLNAVQGLARTARAESRWQDAAAYHLEALDGFDELTDLVGIMHSLDGLALCAGALEGDRADLQVRLESVGTLERLRAARTDHRVQSECRLRFTGIYQAALRVAVTVGGAAATTYLLECLCGRRLAGLLEAMPTASATDAAEITAYLNAMADQRLAGRLSPIENRSERVAMLLGATAIRHSVSVQARDAVDDLAASPGNWRCSGWSRPAARTGPSPRSCSSARPP
jgi:tetratricopeptide (TPR) repeat protein